MNSCHFFDSKKVSIKLLNGDIFDIEINEFDDKKTFIEKICSYDEDYKLRQHRIKILKDDIVESIDSKDDISIHHVDDGDIIYVFCEPVCVETINIRNYFLKDLELANYFRIETIESCYDAIDAMHLEVYNKDLPIFLDFFSFKYYNLISVLFNTIFYTKDINHIFVKSSEYVPENYFFNFFENSRDLTTLYLDFDTSQDKNFFDKIGLININDIYISLPTIFNMEVIYIPNILNIHIFNKNSYYYRNIKSCDFILDKFQSKNNSIFIDCHDIYFTKKNPSTHRNGWFKFEEDTDKDITVYKHVCNSIDSDIFKEFLIELENNPNK